jgi:hypothetical protein
MELKLSAEDIYAIGILVAPGYLAIRAYASAFAQAEKDFSRLLVESVAYSLIITSVYRIIWIHVFPKTPLVFTRFRCFVSLMVVSIVLGYVLSGLRRTRASKWLAKFLRITTNPDDDFIRVQFKKLQPNDIVTVTLKSGKIFSGTPQGGSGYRKNGPREYYFNNVAWFVPNVPAAQTWDVQPGSLIIDLADVELIQTKRPLPDS